MTCRICNRANLFELAVGKHRLPPGGDPRSVADGDYTTIARWCDNCGTLFKGDTDDAATPLMLRADHTFVSSGMMVALALVKAGHTTLLQALDVADARHERVFDFIARRTREDVSVADHALAKRYTEMTKEVARMIRSGLRGAS